MPCTVHSAVCLGMQVVSVTIEAALGNGFSGVQLIGLPHDYARDARERIRSALESLGFPLPARRLVVSVRPVEMLKVFRGGLEHLDLPCAIAILGAMADSSDDKKHAGLLKRIATHIKTGEHLFAGQLTLSGTILPPESILPFELLLLNTPESTTRIWSSVCPDKVSRAPLQNFVRVESLGACLSTLAAAEKMPNSNCTTRPSAMHSLVDCNREEKISAFLKKFSSTPTVALALVIAAAGRHHILLAGSPGCGKTFALRHLKDLLPPLSHREHLEVALIHQRDPHPADSRPFRHPHHSASAAALLGGSQLQPGEVSLAHHGLLFLDELAEFPRPALEALREPLDERKITLSRSRGRVELPAHFLLSSATNPCACGFFFSRVQSCRCVGNAPLKYQQKLSGPLLERFSLLLLMDDILEQDQLQKEHRSDNPLAELSADWLRVFQSNPHKWTAQFLQAQSEFWNTNGLESMAQPDSHDSLMQALEKHAALEKLSPRCLARLSELLITLQRLFPGPASNWKNEKFIEALMQLRGLESAMRKGASFLTPTTHQHLLKDTRKLNDNPSQQEFC